MAPRPRTVGAVLAERTRAWCKLQPASTRATPDISSASLTSARPAVVPGGTVTAGARKAPLTGNDHRRADADAIVQIGDVLVVHPDAAVRDVAADRTRIVGAMDGVLAARQG